MLSAQKMFRTSRAAHGSSKSSAPAAATGTMRNAPCADESCIHAAAQAVLHCGVFLERMCAGLAALDSPEVDPDSTASYIV